MPASIDPTLANCQRDGVIKLQGDYSGPAAWRKPLDARSVCTPARVFGPNLAAWIEQGDALVGDRVIRVDLITFGIIAQAATEPQIDFVVCAAARSGNDVLDFQLTHYMRLRA